MTHQHDREWQGNGFGSTERSTEIPGRHNGAVGRMSGTFIDSSPRAHALSQLDDDDQQIPDIVIRRLPIYVRTLRKLHTRGTISVSSEELAEHIGVTAAQIRRDLSYFGKFGKQGKGYDTDFLARAIGSILRLDRQWPVALVGLGNLGRAIAGYRGFTPSSFTIVALFDRNPQNIGMVVNDLEIQSEDHLTTVIARERIKIGIIASPSVFAQDVATRMIEGGVEAILNYAPVILKVPDHVTVREIDPVSALQSMTYYLTNNKVPAGTS